MPAGEGVFCAAGRRVERNRIRRIRIRGAELSGGKGNAECHHYPKYADASDRSELEELPEGLNLNEFFRLVNCDSPSHGFKAALAVPWLKRQLSKQ